MASNDAFAHALLGGALIGLASFLATAGSGRIPGISGMFSRVLRPRPGDVAWRVVFLVGLLVGAGVAFATLPSAARYRPGGSLVLTAIAGVLVGFGTRLGGGCTSGHGVCGLGLGSRTALVATLTFMLAGGTVVWLVRHGGFGALLP